MKDKNIILYKRNIIFFVIIYLLIFVGIFFLEKYTPFCWDDYIHQFVSFPNPNITKYVIPFIPFLNDYADNFSNVSRFVPHLMVTFCRIIDPNIFAFIVALTFLFLCYLCGRIFTYKIEKIFPLSLITGFLIFFLCPGYFVGFLWLSGVCNYLFVGILILIFYLLLTSRKINYKKNIFNYLILFLFGFIVGWSNEGFVVGMAVSTFIYYFFLKRDELNPPRLSLLAGFYLGAFYLCISPWNLYRFFEFRGELSFTNFLYQNIVTLLSLTQIRILPILLISLILFYFIYKKEKFKSFIKSYLILGLNLVFTFLFVLTTNFTSVGSRIPIDFYALIILIGLISRLNLKYLNIGSLISSIAIIFGIIIILPAARLNYRYHSNMVKQIKDGKELIITKSFNPSNLEQRYLISLHWQYSPNSWVLPEMISQYYGNPNNPNFIYEPIYEKISSHHSVWDNITEKGWGNQWIKIPKNVCIDSLNLILRPTQLNEIPFYLRPMKDNFDRYTIEELSAFSFDTIPVLDQKWLVVGEYPMKEIARRQERFKIVFHTDNDTTKRVVLVDSFKEK